MYLYCHGNSCHCMFLHITICILLCTVATIYVLVRFLLTSNIVAAISVYSLFIITPTIFIIIIQLCSFCPSCILNLFLDNIFGVIKQHGMQKPIETLRSHSVTFLPYFTFTPPFLYYNYLISLLQGHMVVHAPQL